MAVFVGRLVARFPFQPPSTAAGISVRLETTISGSMQTLRTSFIRAAAETRALSAHPRDSEKSDLFIARQAAQTRLRRDLALLQSLR